MNKAQKEILQSHLRALIADLNQLRTMVDLDGTVDDIWEKFDGIESQFGQLTERVDELESE